MFSIRIYEVLSYLKYILPIEESHGNDAQKRYVDNLELGVLTKLDPTYSWSFAPYTLMKKARTRAFYEKQPTTVSI